MSDLSGRSAAHETVIHEIAFVRPSEYLVFYQLFRKDRGMFERDLVAGRRSPNVVSENITYFSFRLDLTADIYIWNISTTFARDAKRRDLLAGGFRRLSDRIKRLWIAKRRHHHAAAGSPRFALGHEGMLGQWSRLASGAW